jgi:hypothetical protein
MKIGSATLKPGQNELKIPKVVHITHLHICKDGRVELFYLYAPTPSQKVNCWLLTIADEVPDGAKLLVAVGQYFLFAEG